MVKVVMKKQGAKRSPLRPRSPPKEDQVIPTQRIQKYPMRLNAWDRRWRRRVPPMKRDEVKRYLRSEFDQEEAEFNRLFAPLPAPRVFVAPPPPSMAVPPPKTVAVVPRDPEKKADQPPSDSPVAVWQKIVTGPNRPPTPAEFSDQYFEYCAETFTGKAQASRDIVVKVEGRPGYGELFEVPHSYAPLVLLSPPPPRAESPLSPEYPRAPSPDFGVDLDASTVTPNSLPGDPGSPFSEDDSSHGGGSDDSSDEERNVAGPIVTLRGIKVDFGVDAIEMQDIRLENQELHITRRNGEIDICIQDI